MDILADFESNIPELYMDFPSEDDVKNQDIKNKNIYIKELKIIKIDNIDTSVISGRNIHVLKLKFYNRYYDPLTTTNTIILNLLDMKGKVVDFLNKKKLIVVDRSYFNIYNLNVKKPGRYKISVTIKNVTEVSNSFNIF